ncbi:hypothetical protein GUJ93_ZPchr0006g44639 [Zizania palustris]|uniref:Uncharacterized protein n=1 Tax=Zizania palustris TaxID=103762 RepID=A0A8J5T187_ZIZPA|nr:hypothetical protein GUJ93_ZPchr0006g44639 [Zizania palustris]
MDAFRMVALRLRLPDRCFANSPSRCRHAGAWLDRCFAFLMPRLLPWDEFRRRSRSPSRPRSSFLGDEFCHRP